MWLYCFRSVNRLTAAQISFASALLPTLLSFVPLFRFISLPIGRTKALASSILLARNNLFFRLYLDLITAVMKSGSRDDTVTVTSR